MSSPLRALPRRSALPSLARHLSPARRLSARAHPPKLRYLSAWFCPFAHRATLALEHHSLHIEWEWEEALGWEKRPSTLGEEADGRSVDWFYHWKSPALLQANPSGLVPTLIDASGRAVYESLVCIEFVDELAAQQGSTQLLLPAEPAERARCRIWADIVNKRCCSPYYGVLVKTEEAGRQESFATLVDGLRRFSRELNSEGPFFCGAAPSLVDFSLLPWAFRYYVLEHYKGSAYKIPTDGELMKYHDWLEAMVALPQVARTLPDKDRYLEHVAKYANASARSKVANAVRRGASAHEIDDERDESEAR